MKKDYVPILYIIIYRMMKEAAPNMVMDKGQLTGLLGRHHVKYTYAAVVIKEMQNYGFLKLFNNVVHIMDINVDKVLDNSSKMYRHVGCY